MNNDQIPPSRPSRLFPQLRSLTPLQSNQTPEQVVRQPAQCRISQGNAPASAAADQDIFVTALEYQDVTERISQILSDRPHRAREFQDLVTEVNNLPESTNRLKALFYRLRNLSGLMAAIGASVLFEYMKFPTFATVCRNVANMHGHRLLREALDWFETPENQGRPPA